MIAMATNAGSVPFSPDVTLNTAAANAITAPNVSYNVINITQSLLPMCPTMSSTLHNHCSQCVLQRHQHYTITAPNVSYNVINITQSLLPMCPTTSSTLHNQCSQCVLQHHQHYTLCMFKCEEKFFKMVRFCNTIHINIRTYTTI